MSHPPVKEIMTRDLITVNRNENLLKVSEIFKEHNFHHLPIVDDQGCLAGIISLVDLERIKIGATLFRSPQKESYTQTMLSTMRACEIMTKDTTHLHPDDNLHKAYEIFKKNHFRALPVVGKGHLVGIVTPLDIMAYFFNEKPK